MMNGGIHQIMTAMRENFEITPKEDHEFNELEKRDSGIGKWKFQIGLKNCFFSYNSHQFIVKLIQLYNIFILFIWY